MVPPLIIAMSRVDVASQMKGTDLTYSCRVYLA